MKKPTLQKRKTIYSKYIEQAVLQKEYFDPMIPFVFIVSALDGLLNRPKELPAPAAPQAIPTTVNECIAHIDEAVIAHKKCNEQLEEKINQFQSLHSNFQENIANTNDTINNLDTLLDKSAKRNNEIRTNLIQSIGANQNSEAQNERLRKITQEKEYLHQTLESSIQVNQEQEGVIDSLIQDNKILLNKQYTDELITIKNEKLKQDKLLLIQQRNHLIQQNEALLDENHLLKKEIESLTTQHAKSSLSTEQRCQHLKVYSSKSSQDIFFNQNSIQEKRDQQDDHQNHNSQIKY